MANPILVTSGVLAIATAAAYARYKQLQFEGEQLARDNGFNDGERGFGAIRHAYAAAVLVQEGVDPEIVKVLGDANERRKDFTESPVDIQDRNRDLWNNDRGIENGINSKSKKEVAEKTISDANASKGDGNAGGPLVNRRDDPRITPENFPTRLTPDFSRRQPLTPNSPVTPGDLNNNGIPDILESKFDPNKVKVPFDQSKNWVFPRDPLILDLDGNGIQTVGLAADIYFDYDADGVKTRTGWVGAGDGLLILDRNANDAVDNGAELFGDFTPITLTNPDGSTTTKLAANGFAALASHDTNNDGIIDANDPIFSQLKIWRDASQDGNTGAGELITLAEAGIQSFNLNNTIVNQAQADDNTLTREGSFTLTDGTVRSMNEYNFATDTFNTQFTNEITVADTVKALPNMRGSGNVRELHQAATQSNSLQSLLNQFSTATTRDSQKALLGQMISAWADTSGMAKTIEERGDGKVIVNYVAFGNERLSNNLISFSGGIVSGGTGGGTSGGGAIVGLGDQLINDKYKALINEWETKLHVLEAFNGQYFFNLPDTKSQTRGANFGLTVAPASGSSATVSTGVRVLNIQFTGQQLDFLNQSYNALIDSVYGALVLQTRLKPYLDMVNLVIDSMGVRLDASELDAALLAKLEVAPEAALGDILDLQRYANNLLDGTGYADFSNFDEIIFNLAKTPSVNALLAEFNFNQLPDNDTNKFKVLSAGDDLTLGGNGNDQIYALNGFNRVYAGAGEDVLQGGSGTDYLYGGNGNDRLYGGDGNNRLYGQAGNDRLYGGSGADALTGGTGNDILNGGMGSDTYNFARGDGQDVIAEATWVNGTDTIAFAADIATDDVRVQRVRVQVNNWLTEDELKLTIRGVDDSILVKNAYYGSVDSTIEQITFANGTVWNQETIKSKSLLGDVSDEIIRGYSDRNDLIVSAGGNDNLVGLTGDDTLDGGAGNDALEGGKGSDTYRLGFGGGQDLITDSGYELDTLELAQGVTPADVKVNWTVLGDLTVRLSDGSSVTVRGQSNIDYLGFSEGIDQLKFADGTVWNYAEIARQAIKATPDADNVIGGRFDETFDMLAGDDTIVDTGGYDTYQFGIGDGHDNITDNFGKLVFKAGVNQPDVEFTRDGKDLIATIKTSSDSIRISGWLNKQPWESVIDQFVFDNGVILNKSDVLNVLDLAVTSEVLFGSPSDDLLTGTAKNSTIYGREGNDTLNGGLGNDTLLGENGDDLLEGGDGEDDLRGGVGNDTLDGGAGRDWLDGGEGQNTYIVSRGMGLDTLNVVTTFASQPNDTVLFADGISLSDLSVQLGNTSYDDNPNNISLTGYSSLVIGIGGNDALILQTNFQDLAFGGVQRFRFADGTELTLADIVGLADTGVIGWQNVNDLANTTVIGSQADDDLYGYSNFNNSAPDDVGNNIQTRGNNDRIRLYSDGNVVSAGSGDDEISSTFGNQLIAGEGGDDTIRTGNFNNDSNAVIVFNYGDGNDTVEVKTGTATLVFGVDVATEILSVYFNENGDLTISVANGAGGSIKVVNADPKKITANLEYFEFVDAVGNTRTFDFASWGIANKASLYGATPQLPTSIDFTGFELTGTVAPKGGLEAIAYAQTGNLFATANLANNTLTTGSDVYYGTQISDTIIGLSGNDIMLGLAGNDDINGGDGNDILSGGAGEDILNGGTGDDVLHGGNGSDTLSGGTGNDQLFGDRGGDTYLFSIGDGIVTIEDSHMVRILEGIEGDGYGGNLNYSIDDAPNILNLSDIRFADVTFSAVDGDLVLTINGHPNDKVILKGYNANRATLTNSIDIIRFADGEELDGGNIIGQGINEFIGDNGGDLIGTQFADTLVGGEGNDYIQGKGNSDNLVGGIGSDVYQIDIDGTTAETVIYETFRNGDVNQLSINGYVLSENLRIAFEGNDLILRIDENNTVRFVGFSSANLETTVPVSNVYLSESFENISFQDLIARGVQIIGTELNDDLAGTSNTDTILGLAGDDTLDASAGSDTLIGGEGNDTYLINLGDGIVTIDDVSEGTEINTISFGDGISPEVFKDNLRFESDGNGGHVLLLNYGDVNDVVVIRGFNPDDVLGGQRAISQLQFSDGTTVDYETLVSWTFVVEGDSDFNTLSGTNVGDRLYGYAESDLMQANAGNDVLTGGEGDDALEGGAGRDAYVFNLGDGNDTISDNTENGKGNIVTFGAGITPDDIRLEVNGADLLIHYGTGGDSIRVVNYLPDGPSGARVIDTFEFADGTEYTYNEFINHAPMVTNSFNDFTLQEGQAFSFVLPADLFSDEDGDVLATGIGRVGSNPLPEWLRYDANTRTLSGTPDMNDAGEYLLSAQAIDPYGASANYIFRINVTDVSDVNNAPTVSVALAAQNTLEDAAFSYVIPANAFADVDVGDTLSYGVTLANGNPLPSWLSYNATTRTISGTPTNSEVGNLSFTVTATDVAGATASQNFTLTVVNTNDAPTVSVALAAQNTLEDAAFSYVIPANAFADVDVGDTLSYGVTLANGNPLPSWLSYNATTRTISGTPTNSEVGNLSFTVTATDVAGATASQNFTLTVVNTNDAPTVSVALAAQNTLEDAAFSYVIPANAFADVDVGDTLSYGVTLANGNPLPSWLSYNATTRTISGTPTNSEVGNLSFTVTATDVVGATASQNFTLTVVNTNDAPTVSVALAAQNTLEDVAFSYVIPANAFADVDVGDTLSYGVTLANGNPLPSWLSYNATTRTISGTPTNSEVGNLSFTVTATDVAGATASQNFTLTVVNTNDAPTVSVALAAQNTLEDAAFSYVIPANAFADVDVGDTLSYGVTLANGNPLPSWLSYNATTRTISGTPTNSEVGSLSFTVTASDVAGATASQSFTLTVDNTNDAPTVSVALAAQNTLEDAAFSYVIPANAFADVDVGDTLSYGVTLANGNPLPSWLSYNATTRTISGTPTNSEVGNLSFTVTATDVAGATASQNFTLTVVNTNDAPTVSVALADATASLSQAFSYVVPINAFNDIDVGDTLNYSATLSDGTALPAWLSFNASTRTFSGTPTTSGTISVKVTAKDLANLSASDLFDITVISSNQTINGTNNIDTLNGGSGNDIINGLAGNDILNGNAGNDTLDGGGGNDVLVGGAGNDTMLGGTGDDTYEVTEVGDIVTENAGEGIDNVWTYISNYTLGANLENLTMGGTANLVGTGNSLNNILTGNAGNNTLNGGGGNDVLVGGAGNDTMLGGTGDDTYEVTEVGDIVTENAGEGIDNVWTYISNYTLGANLENLTMGGTANLVGTGNSLNNILTGNAGNNTLNGGGGNDVLVGGAGNDTMLGGTGDDTYEVTEVGDIVTENAGEGIDNVWTYISNYTLGANLENLTMGGTANLVGTGNSLNNVLTGNAGNNILHGGGGNDVLVGGAGTDTMLGGTGDDTYEVTEAGDIVTESAGEGIDNVWTYISNYTLGANLENLTMGGTANLVGTGNSLNNVLTGNAGNNILNGLAGHDTMIGGLGNDTYTVDATGDVVTENLNEGNDLVNVAIATSGGTYTLAANVENAILTNTVAYNLTSNALANYLRGNAANNTLTDTAGGNDILQGLAGIDTFNDTSGNNLFDGGTGNDSFTGGTGRDIFIGGTGNDTITTGTGFDVISFNKGDGADIINASTGADNTISLGGNFAYSDLSLTKTANDLILKMGATDQITLKNWYLYSPTNKSVINLQVVAEAIQGFSLGGADNLRNNRIENFNFTNLVAAFDTAGATANWQLTDARLTTHLLAGSETAAIGGDLAYQYGKNNNLAGMGSLNAQSVISNASFGQTAQTLNNPTVWQAELVKLG